MALDQTKLLDAIISAKDKKFGAFETRLSNYGALKAFVNNTDGLLPASTIDKAKTAPNRLLKIPVLDKQDVTLIDKRSCTIGGGASTSKFAQLAWITKGFTLSHVPADNANNYISAEEDYANQMMNALIKMFSELDNAAVNALEANKSTVLAPSVLASDAGAQYSFMSDDIYWNLSAIMQLNDLNGPFVDVSNTESIAAYLKYWKSFGGGNEQDKMTAFNAAAGGMDFTSYRSSRVALGDTNQQVHYFTPEGSIGIFNWNNWEANNNIDFGNGKKITIKQDPVFGFDWAVTTQIECKDLSATLGAGYEQTYVHSEQWITDFSFVTPYTSDGRTPIIKAVVPKPTAPTT